MSGEQALVVFQLGEEEYALDVERVREVVKVDRITRVPGAPAYVRGIINLRGRVVPVIDLRERLGLNAAPSERPRIMVVEDGAALVGMLVDRASEVLRLRPGQVQPPDEILQEGDSSRFVEAVANLEGRLVVVLRPGELLAREDREAVADILVS